MQNIYSLPYNEIVTLDQIRRNHPDYYTRQRASVILFQNSNRKIESNNFSKTLSERYSKYGFLCLLNDWEPLVPLITRGRKKYQVGREVFA